MKKLLKAPLRRLGLYHPLQRSYRSVLFFMANRYYRWTYRRWKGRGFTCNFCGSSYEQFIPEYPSRNIAAAINAHQVIAGFGENVYCPYCMSKNRERLVKAVIEKSIPINGKKILHLSPETNLYAFLTENAEVQTADFTPGFYRHIDQHIVRADATQLPFASETFDLILANHILEHIPDDLSAMKEIYRVAKKNGLAILQVPYSMILPNTIETPTINDPRQQALLYGQKDHVRIYAFGDYIARLQKAGFTVEVLTPESLVPYRIHAVQETESVFLCRKT